MRRLEVVLVAAAVVGCASAWVHPGVYVGTGQLEAVKRAIADGTEPFASAFAKAVSVTRGSARDQSCSVGPHRQCHVRWNRWHILLPRCTTSDKDRQPVA